MSGVLIALASASTFIVIPCFPTDITKMWGKKLQKENFKLDVWNQHTYVKQKVWDISPVWQCAPVSSTFWSLACCFMFFVKSPQNQSCFTFDAVSSHFEGSQCCVRLLALWEHFCVTSVCSPCEITLIILPTREMVHCMTKMVPALNVISFFVFRKR